MGLLLLFVLTGLTASGEILPGRFILELESAPSTKDIRAATRVRENQQQVRSALAGRRAYVRGSVDTVANALLVEAADPKDLQGLEGVRRVHPVHLYRANLDRALDILRIGEAWQSIGGMSNAGKGIKIGIVDTGIDTFHAAFQDNSMAAPDGYPKFSSDENRRITNGKVIVARSYDGTSALDRFGHGTGVAMAAAGVRHNGPRGIVSGVAPMAWLGAYRVNEGNSGVFGEDTILRALDDAVKDGMDVLNLSFGAPGVTRTEEEVLAVAISQAVGAGVIVVAAAGNDGPDPVTIQDIGGNESAITVGSSENDRGLATPAVVLNGGARLEGTPASNSARADSITASLANVGVACSAVLPVPGKVALIQRGDCTFEEKFRNAEAAGAIGAVVYNNQNAAALVSMDVGSARLKGLFISQNDGLALKDKVAAEPAMAATLVFSDFIPENPDRTSDFSSRGPTVELAIKPDLVAIGSNIITATSGTEANRPETSRYILADGTSFSSPLVAGAAAVLRSARPNLSVAQYRSLLVNTASRFPAGSDAIRVNQTGAGRLDLPAALSTGLSATPVSLSFGESRGQSNSRELTLSNIGSTADTVTVRILTRDGSRPVASTQTVSLGPKATEKVSVQFSGSGLAAGEYQGLIELSSLNSGTLRVPYWMGVRSTQPSQISITLAPFGGPVGSLATVFFRILDAASVPLVDPIAEGSVVSGGGAVALVRSIGADYPGLYVAQFRLSPEPGLNVFRITAGAARKEIRIQGGN